MVVGVVPVLHNGNRRFLRPALQRVGEREGEAAVLRCVLRDGALVVAQVADLFHRVVNRFAGRVLRQVVPCMRPGFARQLNGLAHRLTIRVQLHMHSGRALAVLVVRVVPYLVNVHGSLLNLVLVRQDEPGRSAARRGRKLVTRCSILCHRVCDFLTVSVFGQVSPRGCPLVRVVQRARGTGNFFAVRQQAHRHGIRAHAVLVVAVVPRLRHGNRGFLRRIRISNGKAACGVTRYGRLIAGRHVNFLHGIRYRLAANHGGQVRKAALPVVAVVQRKVIALNRSRLTAVNGTIQLHFHLGSTLAVLVAVIVPHLLNRDGRLLNLVHVRDSERVARRRHRRRVPSRRINFLDGVRDVRTVGLLRQVRPRVRPAAGAQLHRLAHFCAVGEQLRLHRAGAQAVGIVLVGPNLGYANFHGFRCVRVSQRKRVVASGILRGGHRAFVAVNLRLADGIRVCTVFTVHGLFVQRCGPVVRSGKHKRRNNLRSAVAFSAQHVHGNGIRADAVLVVAVNPLLAHAQVHH